MDLMDELHFQRYSEEFVICRMSIIFLGLPRYFSFVEFPERAGNNSLYSIRHFQTETKSYSIRRNCEIRVLSLN